MFVYFSNSFLLSFRTWDLTRDWTWQDVDMKTALSHGKVSANVSVESVLHYSDLTQGTTQTRAGTVSWSENKHELWRSRDQDLELLFAVRPRWETWQMIVTHVVLLKSLFSMTSAAGPQQMKSNDLVMTPWSLACTWSNVIFIQSVSSVASFVQSLESLENTLF